MESEKDVAAMSIVLGQLMTRTPLLEQLRLCAMHLTPTAIQCMSLALGSSCRLTSLR